MAEPSDNESTSTDGLESAQLFARMKEWFHNDWEHHSKWAYGDAGDGTEDGGAKEDFDFVAGRQWDQKSLQTLKEQNRPASVFNRVAPMIDSVAGFEVANRQEVRYIPREEGDTSVNEILTSAAQWLRDEADAEDEESDAFRDAAICGRGWTESRVDYITNPDGDPRIERVDPMEVFPDRDARKPNFVDRKRTWRIRRMDLEDARALVPGVEDDRLHAGWVLDAPEEAKVSGSPIKDYRDIENISPSSECVIVECQWWELEKFVRYVDGMTGQIAEMPVEDFNRLIDRLSSMPPEIMLMNGIRPPLQSVEQYRRVYKRVFIGSDILGEPTPTPVPDHFSYKAITGKRDRNTGQFHGLVRPMKDPQRWTNKLFSQIMHILNSNAKGGLLAERGAFEDDRTASMDYAKADSIVFTNAGVISNNRIMAKPQAPLPIGQTQMLEFAMSSMPTVTGINLEFLGMRDANQPGVLEYQRKQAGVTILATLFDSLRRYRKDQGRLMLGLIQKFLADGRLVRVLGEEKARYVPLLKDQTVGKYDVIVDDAPSAPNAKERNWAVLQDMFPIVGPILSQSPRLIAEAMKMSPLPEGFVQKVTEELSKPPAPPPPEAMVMRRLALADKIGDIQKTQAETENEQASAISRKAKAFKDMSEATAPIVFGDIPSPPMPSLPNGMMPSPPQVPGVRPPMMPRPMPGSF